MAQAVARAAGVLETRSDEVWQAPSWLAVWKADQSVPVSLDDVDGAIAVVERMLAPAKPEDVAVVLGKTLVMWTPPKELNLQDAMPLYVHALSDLPIDLLRSAMAKATKSCEFFPRPATIRDQVASEFSARRHTLSRLKAARGKAAHEQALERQRQERAPAKAAEVREIGERLRAMSDGVVARTKAMKGGAMRAAQ